MESKKYHHGDLKNALVEAGLKILDQEGLSGLTLRKVALKAGVSHAAPYAHFTDKQSLIAAISTEGFKELYAGISRVSQAYSNDPSRQLLEAAWVYVDFSNQNQSLFKVMFSGILEQEKVYPEFVIESQKNFALVVEIVKRCQESGILKPGDAILTAQGIWSAVHGFCSLLMEGQISHQILDKMPLKLILIHILNQMLIKPLVTDHTINL